MKGLISESFIGREPFVMYPGDNLLNKGIYGIPVKPSAYRFMLGDNSEVGIRW